MLVSAALREEWEDICKGAGSWGEASGGAAAAADDSQDVLGGFRLAMDFLGDKAADVIAALSEAQLEALRDYEEEARALVSSIVKLVDGSDKTPALLTIFRESTIGKIRGGIDGYVLAIYDLKASGEHSKRPANKPPPLRRDHAEKMLRLFLTSRMSPDDDEKAGVSMDSGDMLALFDGGRSSFQAALQVGIKGVKRISRVLHLVYSEEAILKRRQYGSHIGKTSTRGFMTLKQLEQVVLVTAEDAAKLGKRANKFYEGSTTGDVLVPIGVPDLQSPIETWRLSVREKRGLMGSARTMGQAVAADTDHREARPSQDRDDDDVEPMNFDQMLPQVYGEVLYRAGAKAVIDLTCSDGVLAAECVALRIPYLGLCFTAAHAAALDARLASVVFRQFVTENSAIYKAPLALMLSIPVGSASLPVRRCRRISGVRTAPGSAAKKSKRAGPSAPTKRARTKAEAQAAAEESDGEQSGTEDKALMDADLEEEDE